MLQGPSYNDFGAKHDHCYTTDADHVSLRIYEKILDLLL